jgi:hypothetical protein
MSSSKQIIAPTMDGSFANSLQNTGYAWRAARGAGFSLSGAPSRAVSAIFFK